MMLGMVPESNASNLPSTWLAEMPRASEKLRTVAGNCKMALLLRGAAVLVPVRFIRL